MENIVIKLSKSGVQRVMYAWNDMSAGLTIGTVSEYRDSLKQGIVNNKTVVIKVIVICNNDLASGLFYTDHIRSKVIESLREKKMLIETETGLFFIKKIKL